MENSFDNVMRIKLYTHFFKVVEPRPHFQGLILRFIKHYVQMGFEKGSDGRSRPVAIRTYASTVQGMGEFRFHIGQLPHFKEFLEANYVTSDQYEIVEIPLKEASTLPYKSREKWVLRDQQPEASAFIINDDPDAGKSRLIAMPTGEGKAQPLDAMVKIPGGWTKMGLLQVGDYVIARDGTNTQITGVFPQGEKHIFKITFKDGRSTECCGEHLWKIHRHDYRGSNWRVVSTRELIRIMGLKGGKVHIDLPDPEPGVDAILPLDPYVLGVLLGDGNLKKNALMISTPDQFILDEITKHLPDELAIKYGGKYDYRISQRNPSGKEGKGNPWVKIIKSLGLNEKLSDEKFVPSQYLEGSSRQRLAILQGLLDTDGTIGLNGTVSYCSTSEVLAKNVQYLVRSLGGIAGISIRSPNYTYNGVLKKGKRAYQVNIRYKKQSELFRLPKKKDRTNDFNQYAEGLKLKISKIEHIGIKEAQCISIAHPERLYVTDDFIVTHNTVTSLLSTHKRVLVVVLGRFMEKWGGDIHEIIDIKKKEIMVVRGGDQLKGLIQMAKDGHKIPSHIVISLTTLRLFYEEYEKDPKYTSSTSYGITPEKLCELLGIGAIIVDEAHEHLHAVFKLMLYTHVDRFIALTATLITLDPFEEKIHKLMFPKTIRFEKIKMKKYIKAYAFSYQIDNIIQKKVKTTEYGSNTYSHTAFEKSIVRNKVLLEKYLELINFLVHISYIRDYQSGDKLAVFVGTIELATIVTEYLKQKHPTKDVRRYVEKDPYCNVIEAGIRVTTILSAGTAIDIPGLVTTIMTNSIRSPKANLQTLGRLRKIDGRIVKFLYTYCENIKKQVDYHFERRDLIADRVASFKELKSPIDL